MLRNMGHACSCSRVVRMLLLLIIIFLFASFLFTHTLVGDAAEDELYESSSISVSSQEEKHHLILKNLRLFLAFKKGNSRNGDSWAHLLSPSPASSPSPLPGIHTPRGGGAPSPSIHRHAHPPFHYSHVFPQAHKVQKNEDNGKGNRALTAVLLSVGISSALCAVGLFFLCRKFKNQKRRRPKRVVSRFMSSQLTSVKKVSSDPGPDLFYLNSLESALDLEPGKESNVTMSSCVMNEREASVRKIVRPESEDGDVLCSSFGEITIVREISEPVDIFEQKLPEKEKRVQDETHSSSSDDDESFHSVCDSHSFRSSRLSNASSAHSVGEISEATSQNDADEALPNPVDIASSATQSPPPPPPPQPPAPPKCLAQVPPPPCPPLNVPPPPPSQLHTQVPLGKDGSPLPKLKPLHWDKVRATPDRSTVWDKLRSSSFEFDEEMIESLFGYNLQSTMRNDEVKSKTPSPSKHVLEPKRLQNITILSKALNVSAEQVCGALIRGEGLSLQDLEALSKMVPTKEEEAKLANYKGDTSELGSAENLVQAMLKIQFAFVRIEVMLYRETFDDEVLHLKKSYSMLEDACKELRSSRLFLKLLEAVLKTGNRMNVGTIRGGAKAFKLDALLKLADVKGTDGKTTLLHFVVLEIVRSEGLRVSESIMGRIDQLNKRGKIEDKEDNYRKMGLELVSGLSTELCNAKKTATLDLETLTSSVLNLSHGMSELKHFIEKETGTLEGSFVNSMRSFLKCGETKLKELQEDEKRVMLLVREITEYFHGDVGKDESNPLRIFVIVRDFLNMLDHVCKELRSTKANNNPLAPFK